MCRCAASPLKGPDTPRAPPPTPHPPAPTGRG
jgi:hypothetical protein